SSPKKGVSRLKTTTRTSLVAKKSSFLPKNSDEIRARRQKHDFLTQNDDEIRSRRQKHDFLT
ncbi:hypothetical protein LIZ98_17880, partial [Caldibacillus sp. 210928-DFI.2.18]|uniref:hypothetical protein n=1 Tax=Caldibacillus sp. 210928-DFI.2.18 TaxID=2883264 RepID=UPI001D0782C2